MPRRGAADLPPSRRMEGRGGVRARDVDSLCDSRRRPPSSLSLGLGRSRCLRACGWDSTRLSVAPVAATVRACLCATPPPHHHCHKPLAPRPPPLVRAERSPAPRGSRDPCARGKAPWPGNSVRESLCAEPTERLSRAVPREGARRLRRGGTLLATQGDSEGGEAAHPFPPSPNHRRDRHGPPTLNTAKHTVVGGAEGGGGCGNVRGLRSILSTKFLNKAAIP